MFYRKTFIKKEQEPKIHTKFILASTETGHVEQVSDDSYEKLLGYKIPDGAWNGELEKNDAFVSCIMQREQLEESFIGYLIK